MTGGRQPVPVMWGSRRAERQSLLTALGSGGLVVLLLGHLWITRPTERVWVLLTGLVVLGVPILLMVRETQLDTVRGQLVRRVLGMEWATAWRDLSVLRFRDNGLGQVLLQARGRGRLRSAYVPVVAADGRGTRSQSPAFLRLLAAEVERWAPDRTSVAAELRAQVAHLEAGGQVFESPLLQRYCRRLQGRR